MFNLFYRKKRRPISRMVKYPQLQQKGYTIYYKVFSSYKQAYSFAFKYMETKFSIHRVGFMKFVIKYKNPYVKPLTKKQLAEKRQYDRMEYYGATGGY